MRDILLDVLSLLLTAAVPVLIGYLHRWLGIQADSRAAAVVNLAVERGAGLIYREAATGMDVLAKSSAMASLTNTAAGQVMARIPDAAARLGVTHEHVRQMIQSELGRLLAVDPTVSVIRSPTQNQ